MFRKEKASSMQISCYMKVWCLAYHYSASNNRVLSNNRDKFVSYVNFCNTFIICCDVTKVSIMTAQTKTVRSESTRNNTIHMHTTKVQDIIVPCYFTYKQQNLVRNGIMKKVYVGDTLNMAKNQNNFIAQKTDRMLPFFISWTSMQFALRIKMRASTCTAWKTKTL